MRPPTTTPLLEALKAEKSAQKDKEAILRNHAHYKDPSTLASLTSGPKHADSKKKGGASAGGKDKAVAENSAGPSKKASKKAAAAAKAQRKKAHEEQQMSWTLTLLLLTVVTVVSLAMCGGASAVGLTDV